MFLFWAVAGVLAAVAAGLILFRATGAAQGAGVVDPASILYRRQLNEIGDLAERGLIGEAERKSTEAEAARRLLAVTDAPAQPWTADTRARAWVLLAAAAAPALALGLYLKLGAPGVPDQPFAQRLEAWQKGDLASLTAPEVAAVLRKAVSERPNEAEGYRLLGLAEDASQNPLAAVQALRKAAKLAPERADIWRMLGQAEVVATGGKVDETAQNAFEKLLTLEPGDPVARFYLATAKADAGNKAEAETDLRGLLADLPPGSNGAKEVQATLARLQGQTAATGDPQQMAMIRGMVDGLAARLKTAPDDPAGWVKLVRAYAVLGDTANRDTVYASARARYATQPAVLQQLDEAARAEPMR